MYSTKEHCIREELYQKGLSDQEIAKKLFTSAQAVFYWRKKRRLPPNLNPGRPLSNSFIKRKNLYDKGLSDYAIAEICNVTPPTIKNWRDKHGFKAHRDPGQPKKKNYKKDGTGV